jgi:hypothetical protein
MDELVQKILGGRRSKRHEGHPKVDLRAYMGRIHGGVEAQTIDEPIDDLAGGSAELEAGQKVYTMSNGSKYIKLSNGRPRIIAGSNKAYMKKIRSKPRSKKSRRMRKY